MKNNAFKRKNKIYTTKQFQQIFKYSQKAKNEYLSVYMKISKYNYNQIGIIVSKKIKKAVIRNKYKRLIREYFRLQQNKFSQRVKLIIMINKDMPKRNYHAIGEILKPVLQKIGIILI